MQLQVKCEICQEIIGAINTGIVRYPLTGNMFLSKDMLHGFPPPFPGDVGWEDFRCPYCRNNPVILPRRLLTSAGYLVFNDGGAELIDDGLSHAQRETADRVGAEEAAGDIVRGVKREDVVLPIAVPPTIVKKKPGRKPGKVTKWQRRKTEV
jgi:hypothetical protein